MDLFQAKVDVLVIIYLFFTIVILLILCFYRRFTGKNSNVADIVQYFFWLNHFFPFRLGQVRLGQVRLGQVRLGQVRLDQVRLGQVRLGQVRLDQVRLGQIRLGQVRLGQVRLGQVYIVKGKKCVILCIKVGEWILFNLGGVFDPPFAPFGGKRGENPKNPGIREHVLFFFHKTTHPTSILQRGDPPLFLISYKSSDLHRSPISTPSGRSNL